MHPDSLSPVTRACVHVLVWSLLWSPLAPVARAASSQETDLSDVPTATKGRAKPSVLFVIDDSGSMDNEITLAAGFQTNEGTAWWNTRSRSFLGWGFQAQDTGYTDVWQGGGANAPGPGVSGIFATDPPKGPTNFNAGGAGSVVWKQYGYLFPNGQCGANCATRTSGDGANDMFAVPPTREFGWLRSPVYNAQYYNPSVRYDPWRPYNDGAQTITPVEYTDSTSWTQVRSHPVYTGATSDVTTTVAKPGDAFAAFRNKVFVMYPGMILPAGARYRICRGNGNSITGQCSNTTNVWADVATDTCITTLASQNASYCHFANAYGVTATVAIDGNGLTDALKNANPNRIEAQIDFKPATYWALSNGSGALAADEALGPDGRRLRRVEIGGSGSFARAFTRTDCAGSTCSAAEEMANFANWFAYHRKRLLMLNAAMGVAFDQTQGLRAGAFAFNDRVNATMYDFDVANDALNYRRLLGRLYRFKGNGSTPTREALAWAGTQFERGVGDDLPVFAMCQFSSAFVITDGFAKNSGVPGFENQDANPGNRFTIPYSSANTQLNYTPDGSLPKPPDALPAVTVTPAAPFVDNETNTLADIAMKYYQQLNIVGVTDQRMVPINLSDDGKDADRNDLLHMNTYALTLGMQGEIFGRTDTAQNIAYNADPYTIPAWPVVTNGGAFIVSPRTIDELWHATVNSRGRMLSASSPDDTRLGVVEIVNNVGAKGGAGAAVAVANPNVTPGDNFSYASTYNSGSWAGDINKYEIDPVSGQPSLTPLWVPSPQIQLATTPPSRRVIVTFNDASASSRDALASSDGQFGVPFQWSSLSTSQQGFFTSTQRGVTSVDSQVLDFIRGDRSQEVDKFRSRGSRPLRDDAGNFIVQSGRYVYRNNQVPRDIAVLGDIVDAEPVIVRAPRYSYFDSGYQEFRDQNLTRQGVLYQGANDGMLHAFDLASGTELWAYVPSLVLPRIRNLSDRANFRHQYYVDGTPVVGDVDFARAGSVADDSSTSNWHTLLVSGLGKGGFGYFALDVTVPDTGSEADISRRVLWEFPNRLTPSDAVGVDVRNIGYSYGRPVIAKTRAAGWVVLVASGYNNGSVTTGGDGKGRLFVLNARTGEVIRELVTSAGSPDQPSGLARISAFGQRPDVDATIEAAYGGDLLGNVWRFDLSGASVDDWSVAKLAELRTESGQVQPVTTEPELGLIQGKRVIFVGTGQSLGESDVLNAPTENDIARRTQSMYALVDPLTAGSGSTPLLPTPTRGGLVKQTATLSGDKVLITTNVVNFADSAGWYVDLPTTGERSVTNPVLSGGVLSFTTNVPDSTDKCSPGGSSFAYFLDFATGGIVTNAQYAGIKMGNFLSSRIVLIRVSDGIVGLVRTAGGSSSPGISAVKPPVKPEVKAGRRISWREVPDAVAP